MKKTIVAFVAILLMMTVSMGRDSQPNRTEIERHNSVISLIINNYVKQVDYEVLKGKTVYLDGPNFFEGRFCDDTVFYLIIANSVLEQGGRITSNAANADIQFSIIFRLDKETKMVPAPFDIDRAAKSRQVSLISTDSPKVEAEVYTYYVWFVFIDMSSREIIYSDRILLQQESVIQSRKAVDI